MNWLALIPCLVLAALPPLTDDQREMLATTPDLTVSYDQPGLYALLANAQSWSNDPTANEAGSRLPDYAAIRENTAQWRGESCLIEGTLVARIDFGLLARIDYDNVQSWAVRTPGITAPDGTTSLGGIIIVFLADPPPVQWGVTRGQNTAPLTQDMKLRLVARFFTVLQQSNLKDDPSAYPVFVGRSAAFVEPPAASSGVAYRPLLVITLIFAMIVGYIVVLVVRIRRNRETRRNKREQPAEASRRKRKPVELRDDLPDDPAEAMNALENENEQQD
ncbi:MAG: hypothetical protein WC058_00560 [Phycisphaeraceae bacterium]